MNLFVPHQAFYMLHEISRSFWCVDVFERMVRWNSWILALVEMS